MIDDDKAPKALGEIIRDECGDLDPYECESAIRRLNDYLDHQLSDNERVVVLKHLEICRPCLRRFTFEQTLIISLRQKISCVCMPSAMREKLHVLLHQEPKQK